MAIGPYMAGRLMKKQARLVQKLARVQAKLARSRLSPHTVRARAHYNPAVSAVRGIVTAVAFGGLWWLGCRRVNNLIDGIFGADQVEHMAPPRVEPQSANTFWTFGRRRRAGQTEIGNR
jgi:hypothetical protein